MTHVARKTARLTTVARAVRILCALAMLSLGLAHRPLPADAGPFDPAFRLPDGSYADICREGDENHSHNRRPLAVTGCEVCRLTGAALLPKPDSGAWLKTDFAWLTVDVPDGASVAAHPAVVRPQSRAPPVTS